MRPWSVAAILAVLTCAVLIPQASAAAPGAVVDHNDSPDGTSSWMGGQGGFSGQFTAGVTGQLTDVVVWIDNQSCAGESVGTGPWPVKIVDDRTGNSLANSEVSAPTDEWCSTPRVGQPSSIPVGYQEADIAFPAPAVVVAGRTYDWEIDTPPVLCWIVTDPGSEGGPSEPVTPCDWPFSGGFPNPPAGEKWGNPAVSLGDGHFDTPGHTNPWAFQTWVVPAPPDTQPPSTPGGLAGKLSGGTLNLTWAASTDNLAVDHYNVYRGSQLAATVNATSTSATVRGFALHGQTDVMVKAVDVAGNVSAASQPIVVVPTARPTSIPKSVPTWAYKLLAWQHTHAGSRPRTPSPLPAWYAVWKRWKFYPFEIVA